MLATTGRLPAGPGWAYEFKWDGVRAIAEVSGGAIAAGARLPAGSAARAGSASRVGSDARAGSGAGAVRFYARTGSEITVAYPELAPLSGLVDDAVLDGELVVLDATGRPSFGSLAERMHVRDVVRAAKLAVTLPVTYMIFDLLRLDGQDLTGLPYTLRRAGLEALGLAGRHWLVPPSFTDGAATVAAAQENALEGVVAKRIDSPYRPGARSSDWIKIKLELTGDFVIGGWRPGARRIGGLLIGAPGPDGTLRFQGRVGGGIGAAAERDLLAVLEPLRVPRSPFTVGAVPREDARGAIWTRPEAVVEVRYGQLTPDGRLRFPRFLRLRPDKTPQECASEDPGTAAWHGTGQGMEA